MANQLEVTVCSLAYNNGESILNSIKSISRQKNVEIEHYIVDDFSTDDTVEVIEKWISENNYKCTFVKNKKNNGITSNLNLVLDKTTTPYFMGLGDDVLSENKISNDIKTFNSLPENYAVVFSDMYKVDIAGKKLNEKSYLNLHCQFFPEIPKGDIYLNLLEENFITAPTAICKTSYLKKINGYDESLAFEDWDAWLRISRAGGLFYFDNRIETDYIILNTSLTGKGPSLNKFHSILDLVYKHKAVSIEADVIVRNHLIHFSERIHEMKSDKAVYWYKKRIELDKSVRAKLFYRLAQMKFSYSLSNKIVKFCCRFGK